MEVCGVWLARDFLRRAGRPLDIPPCGHSAAKCPPITPKEHEMTTTPLPKVYIGGAQLGDLGVLGFAVAEDGEPLAEHLCSDRGYIRHDVHDRRPETYDAKFGGHTPGEHYELVPVGAWSTVPEGVRAANKALADSQPDDLS